MKQTILEENLEAIEKGKGKTKSSPQKNQSNTTSGLEEINPVNLFTDMITSAIGPPKSPQELAQRKVEEEREKARGISQEKNILRQEINKLQKPKGNLEVINPPKPRPETVPAYISGKPGYNPEKEVRQEKQAKNKLPPLTVPPSKPRRGDLFGIERKQRGFEDKSGYKG